MALAIGIIGLPNVGKSTIFNALTREQNAQSANYPFCTIEPNKAVVPVPDERLEKLSNLVEPQQIVAATVDFVDIAGLVKGASKGEGLGNKFLANIRQSDALLHVVRCFEDDNIVHVDGSVDPIRDIEIIETELLLADLQSLESRLEKLVKQVKADKKMKVLQDTALALKAHLEQGKMAASFPPSDELEILRRELGLLTMKKCIYCANVDESGATEGNEHIVRVEKLAAERDAVCVRICARMEEELGELSDEERQEYLDSYGLKQSGLQQVVQSGYRLLGLISYFTAGPKEVKAWTISQGCKAPQAAGVIHSDFERGFIRAEVIGYNDYITHKTEAGCRAAGVLRVEGKEYIVADGDIMHFLFNV